MPHMNIINTNKELKTALKKLNGTIGFVPNVGTLPDGHISLIRKAREENDIVIVSIFINPTQFLAGEDLDKYPSKMEADQKICELSGVDILFTPNINIMYGKDEVLIKAPILRSFILEGQKRPSHFDGVLQIVLKLFNLVQPDNAYFGKKDAQQLSLIKQMVNNLFLDINIIQCDIIREPDGLAMSSRNIYLTKQQRELSLNISKSLRAASHMIADDIINCEEIILTMGEILKDLEIEYISIVNQQFEQIKEVEFENTIILVAAKIGNTRLIDNIWI